MNNLQTIGQKYTFWEFLKENGIVIPVIQRDYAQGRIGKEDLRNRFLKSLKNSLDDRIPSKPMILDFIYGVHDVDGINVIPLDGQQRLTTLWLLHWYILIKSSKNKQTIKTSVSQFKKFTYKTRMSSELFCNALCEELNIFQVRKNLKDCNIRKSIISQTWFMSEWEQDPTVKAMLNMLESIESFFQNEDFNNSWEILTNSQKCPLVFYYLNIDEEISQEPDDVYIKLNARGEHLTDFENFKADLIKYARDKSSEWKAVFGDNPELELSKLIDNDWTDVFWQDLPKEQKKLSEPSELLPSVDRQFFGFINRFFINIILLKSKDAKNLTKENSNDNNEIRQLFQHLYRAKDDDDLSVTYKDFSVYENSGIINPDNFKELKSIFVILKDKYKEIINNIKPKWDEEFNFIPKEDDKTPSQIQRVVSYGVCCYLKNCCVLSTCPNVNACSYPFEQNTFKEWMRFVWNLARNSDVQNIEIMANVIKKLNKIKYNNHTIIQYLKNQNEIDEHSLLDRQWNEEIKKAKLYINKEKLINKAEKYFHGSIRFLLSDDQKLLNHKNIENLKQLVKKDDWIIDILPFINNDVFVNTKKLIFHYEGDDNIKTINRDNNIVNAVQNYLINKKNTISENDWRYPLLNIKDHSKTLIEYSYSKKIGKYTKNNIESVYLYKTNVWKKDDCILLNSTDSLQDEINKRNAFIIDKLKNGFDLDFNIDEKDQNKCYPFDNKAHHGRAIVIKNDSDTLYCHVNGYLKNDESQQNKYPEKLP